MRFYNKWIGIFFTCFSPSRILRSKCSELDSSAIMSLHNAIISRVRREYGGRKFLSHAYFYENFFTAVAMHPIKPNLANYDLSNKCSCKLVSYPTRLTLSLHYRLAV